MLEACDVWQPITEAVLMSSEDESWLQQARFKFSDDSDSDEAESAVNQAYLQAVAALKQAGQAGQSQDKHSAPAEKFVLHSQAISNSHLARLGYGAGLQNSADGCKRRTCNRACRLRGRVVHVAPSAVKLAPALLKAVLKHAHVMQPLTEERLLTWKIMKMTMKQFRRVLNNGLSDPVVEWLVYKVT
ncbi:hypothetical protein WJX79_003296 [Trebouxia sp. C0005]